MSRRSCKNRVYEELLKLRTKSQEVAHTRQGVAEFELLAPFEPAVKDDIRYESIYNLLASTFRTNRSQIKSAVYRGRNPHDGLVREQDLRHAACLVAGLWLGGRLVCAASLRVNVPESTGRPEELHVQTVYQTTASAYQQRGLGRLLTRCIARAAVAAGHKLATVVVMDKEVQHCWTKLGFREVTRRDAAAAHGARAASKRHAGTCEVLLADLAATVQDADLLVAEAVRKVLEHLDHNRPRARPAISGSCEGQQRRQQQEEEEEEEEGATGEPVSAPVRRRGRPKSAAKQARLATAAAADAAVWPQGSGAVASTHAAAAADRHRPGPLPAVAATEAVTAGATTAPLPPPGSADTLWGRPWRVYDVCVEDDEENEDVGAAGRRAGAGRTIAGGPPAGLSAAAAALPGGGGGGAAAPAAGTPAPAVALPPATWRSSDPHSPPPARLLPPATAAEPSPHPTQPAVAIAVYPHRGGRPGRKRPRPQPQPPPTPHPQPGGAGSAPALPPVRPPPGPPGPPGRAAPVAAEAQQQLQQQAGGGSRTEGASWGPEAGGPQRVRCGREGEGGDGGVQEGAGGMLEQVTPQPGHHVERPKRFRVPGVEAEEPPPRAARRPDDASQAKLQRTPKPGMPAATAAAGVAAAAAAPAVHPSPSPSPSPVPPKGRHIRRELSGVKAAIRAATRAVAAAQPPLPPPWVAGWAKGLGPMCAHTAEVLRALRLQFELVAAAATAGGRAAAGAARAEDTHGTGAGGEGGGGSCRTAAEAALAVLQRQPPTPPGGSGVPLLLAPLIAPLIASLQRLVASQEPPPQQESSPPQPQPQPQPQPVPAPPQLAPPPPPPTPAGAGAGEGAAAAAAVGPFAAAYSFAGMAQALGAPGSWRLSPAREPTPETLDPMAASPPLPPPLPLPPPPPPGRQSWPGEGLGPRFQPGGGSGAPLSPHMGGALPHAMLEQQQQRQQQQLLSFQAMQPLQQTLQPPPHSLPPMFPPETAPGLEGMALHPQQQEQQPHWQPMQMQLMQEQPLQQQPMFSSPLFPAMPPAGLDPLAAVPVFAMSGRGAGLPFMMQRAREWPSGAV